MVTSMFKGASPEVKSAVQLPCYFNSWVICLCVQFKMLLLNFKTLHSLIPASADHLQYLSLRQPQLSDQRTKIFCPLKVSEYCFCTDFLRVYIMGFLRIGGNPHTCIDFGGRFPICFGGLWVEFSYYDVVLVPFPCGDRGFHASYSMKNWRDVVSAIEFLTIPRLRSQ